MRVEDIRVERIGNKDESYSGHQSASESEVTELTQMRIKPLPTQTQKSRNNSY